MSTGIFYPVAASDDGMIWDPAPNFYDGNGHIRFGKSDVNPTQWFYAFIRFPNVTIPNNYNITAAYLKLTAYKDNAQTTVSTLIHCNAVDDAVAPTSHAEYLALALTSGTAWTSIPAWVDGTQYDSIDFAAELQAVVSRAGFASGQAVMVLIKDNASSNSAGRSASDVVWNTGLEVPELHVEWGPPLPEDLIASWNPYDAGDNLTFSTDLLTATHA